MSTKINRAKKLAKCGQYHQTFAACIDRIPADVIAKINSRDLAALVDAMHDQYQAGHNIGYKDAD